MDKEALKIKWWIFPLDGGYLTRKSLVCPTVCQIDMGKGVTLVLSLTLGDRLFPSSSLLTSIKDRGKVLLLQRSTHLGGQQVHSCDCEVSVMIISKQFILMWFFEGF